jgi:hypothetical protein
VYKKIDDDVCAGGKNSVSRYRGYREVISFAEGEADDGMILMSSGRRKGKIGKGRRNRKSGRAGKL